MKNWNSSQIELVTPVERRIIRSVARGYANAEIALERACTEHTIKSHLGHVYRKLEIRNRSQLVCWAYEVGLLVPSSVARGNETRANVNGRGETPAQAQLALQRQVEERHRVATDMRVRVRA